MKAKKYYMQFKDGIVFSITETYNTLSSISPEYSFAEITEKQYNLLRIYDGDLQLVQTDKDFLNKLLNR